MGEQVPVQRKIAFAVRTQAGDELSCEVMSSLSLGVFQQRPGAIDQISPLAEKLGEMTEDRSQVLCHDGSQSLSLRNHSAGELSDVIPEWGNFGKAPTGAAQPSPRWPQPQPQGACLGAGGAGV